MNVDCQPRAQEIAKLIRRGQYRVDPVAVADAVVSRIVWEDVPDVARMIVGPRRHRPARLRGLIRVRRLATGALPPPRRLSA